MGGRLTIVAAATVTAWSFVIEQPHPASRRRAPYSVTDGHHRRAVSIIIKASARPTVAGEARRASKTTDVLTVAIEHTTTEQPRVLEIRDAVRPPPDGVSIPTGASPRVAASRRREQRPHESLSGEAMNAPRHAGAEAITTTTSQKTKKATTTAVDSLYRPNGADAPEGASSADARAPESSTQPRRRRRRNHNGVAPTLVPSSSSSASDDDGGVAAGNKRRATTKTSAARRRKSSRLPVRRLLPEEEAELSSEIHQLTEWEKIRVELNATLGRLPTEREWARAAGFGSDDAGLLKFAARRLRCRRAKSSFVSANLPLVHAVAKRYRWVVDRSSVGYEDLVQEGIFGLTRAVERFDPSLGYRFSTYAAWWIRQSIQSAVWDQSRVIRLPPRLQHQLRRLEQARRDIEARYGRDATDAELAEALDVGASKLVFLKDCGRTTASPVVSFDADHSVSSHGSSGSRGSSSGHYTLADTLSAFSASSSSSSYLHQGQSDGGASLGSARGGRGAFALENVVSADDRDCPARAFESSEFKASIRRLLRLALNPRECAVLQLRYGLDDGEPKSLNDIAAMLSASPSQIRAIKAKALNKLRQPHSPGNHILRAHFAQEHATMTNTGNNQALFSSAFTGGVSGAPQHGLVPMSSGYFG